MKKVFIILLLIISGLLTKSQFVTDTIIAVQQNGDIVKYVVRYPSATFTIGDSIPFRSTIQKKQGIMSPLSLPINTATQAALDLKATILKDSATLNFDLTALSYQDLNVTVVGAALGDMVCIGAPNGAVVIDLTYFGWVSGTNTVSIRASRVGGGGATDPPSGTFKIAVFK